MPTNSSIILSGSVVKAFSYEHFARGMTASEIKYSSCCCAQSHRNVASETNSAIPRVFPARGDCVWCGKVIRPRCTADPLEPRCLCCRLSCSYPPVSVFVNSHCFQFFKALPPYRTNQARSALCHPPPANLAASWQSFDPPQ